MKKFWLFVISFVYLMSNDIVLAAPSGKSRKEQRHAQRIATKKAKKDLREYRAEMENHGVLNISLVIN